MNKGTVLAMFYAYQETRETIRFLFVRWKGGEKYKGRSEALQGPVLAAALQRGEGPRNSATAAPACQRIQRIQCTQGPAARERLRTRAAPAASPGKPWLGTPLAPIPNGTVGQSGLRKAARPRTNSQLQLCFQPPRMCAKYVQLQRAESVLMHV